MRVCVVGVGKIGLPLAALIASRGHKVVGCDLNVGVVEAINRGKCLLVNEPLIGDMIAEAVRDDRLRATTDTTGAASTAEVSIIVVPLLVDEDGTTDYSAIDAAVEAVGRGLQPNSLVIVETTVPVGDTRNRFGPLLERASGMRLEEDFYLAFSPERVQSNRVIRDLNTYPKLVGGIGPASTQRAEQFYSQVVDAPVMALSSSEAAEFTKLAESVYRDVNIALATQLARYAEESGVDMAEVIPAANSEPLSHLHRPGLGVGGHCIPVYPHFMLSRTEELSLVALAREVNDTTPLRFAERLEKVLDGLAGRTIVLLGLAYRANVKEAFLSPALTIASELEGRGARVLINDPLFTDAEVLSTGFEPVAMDQIDKHDFDAVIVHSFHKAYEALDLTRLDGCKVIVDGAGALDREAIERAGMVYLRAGLGVSETRALVAPIAGLFA